MPSIELVCTDQSEPLEFSGLPFALVANRELVSHRPRPLFQRELSRLRGCMYHVGSPQCARLGYQGAFFAYEVLSAESRERQRRRVFEMAPKFREEFHRVASARVREAVFGAGVGWAADEGDEVCSG